MVRFTIAIGLPRPRGPQPPHAGHAGVRPRMAPRSVNVGSDPGRRVAVLISGRGSNLQALIDAIADGRLRAEIAIVISNKADAYGLERARAAGIETLTIAHRAYPTRDAFEE